MSSSFDRASIELPDMFRSSCEQELRVGVNDDMDFSLEWTALPCGMVLSHGRHLVMFVQGLVRNKPHIYHIPFSSRHFETNGVSGTREVYKKKKFFPEFREMYEGTLSPPRLTYCFWVQIAKQPVIIVANLGQMCRQVDLICNR